mmetsp:Transcript_24174/g.33521  ORF Transcript_24174/g.33521 Transcript_24174/m.33521 type:complete len:450 (+) Transcript_24174:118-1467(+)
MDVEATVTIKNLTIWTTEEQLHDEFKSFGEIDHAIVVRGNHQVSHRYGYIKFRSEESARSAILAKDGHEFQGQMLAVTLATHKDKTIIAQAVMMSTSERASQGTCTTEGGDGANGHCNGYDEEGSNRHRRRLPCRPLNVDPAAFKEKYCHFEGVARMVQSGAAILRGAIPDDELSYFAARVNGIPLPTRYLCGASDQSKEAPPECVPTDEEIARNAPQMLMNIDAAFEQLDMGKFYVRGHHEFVLVSKDTVHDIGGEDIDSVMRNLYREDDQLTEIGAKWHLTMKHNRPVFDGYHDWHMDTTGVGIQGEGDVHEWLGWVMIERNVSEAVKDTGKHPGTGLVVIPVDAYAEYQERIPEWDFECRKKLYEEISCTLQLDEGDFVIYRADMLHRSQDRNNDRIALTVDIVPSYADTDDDMHHRDEAKNGGAERRSRDDDGKNDKQPRKLFHW